MYKIWAKIIIDNKIKTDYVIDIGDISNNKKNIVMSYIEEICYNLDLSRPIWLDKHTTELAKHNRVHFYPEHFVDYTNFDYLELEVYKQV